MKNKKSKNFDVILETKTYNSKNSDYRKDAQEHFVIVNKEYMENFLAKPFKKYLKNLVNENHEERKSIGSGLPEKFLGLFSEFLLADIFPERYELINNQSKYKKLSYFADLRSKKTDKLFDLKANNSVNYGKYGSRPKKYFPISINSSAKASRQIEKNNIDYNNFFFSYAQIPIGNLFAILIGEPIKINNGSVDKQSLTKLYKAFTSLIGKDVLENYYNRQSNTKVNRTGKTLSQLVGEDVTFEKALIKDIKGACRNRDAKPRISKDKQYAVRYVIDEGLTIPNLLGSKHSLIAQYGYLTAQLGNYLLYFDKRIFNTETSNGEKVLDLVKEYERPSKYSEDKWLEILKKEKEKLEKYGKVKNFLEPSRNFIHHKDFLPELTKEQKADIDKKIIRKNRLLLSYPRSNKELIDIESNGGEKEKDMKKVQAAVAVTNKSTKKSGQNLIEEWLANDGVENLLAKSALNDDSWTNFYLT